MIHRRHHLGKIKAAHGPGGIEKMEWTSARHSVNLPSIV
jgi:hypothetical protein